MSEQQESAPQTPHCLQISEKPATCSTKAALLTSVAVFVAMFTLYATTANHYTAYDDTPQLMTASIRLGIAHPSGYPLLILLGKAASLLPLGTLAYRLNLLVGLFGALAAGSICLLMSTAFGSVGAAALASVALGVTPVLWENATNFEVYALNALSIVVALLLAAKVWIYTEGNNKHRARYFFLMAFIIGLGTSHHLTFVTSLPAVAWLAFRGRQAWLPDRGQIVKALLVLALGLSPWLYLPIRGALPYDPYTCWVPLKSLRAIFDHITAQQFKTALLAYSIKGLPLLAARAADAIWQQFGPLLLLVPFGLAAMKRRGGVIIEASLCLVGINLALFFGYAVYDYEVFFLPSYVGIAVLIAAGLAWLSSWFTRRSWNSARPRCWLVRWSYWPPSSPPDMWNSGRRLSRVPWLTSISWPLQYLQTP